MKKLILMLLMLSAGAGSYAQTKAKTTKLKLKTTTAKTGRSDIQYVSLGPVIGVGGSWLSNMSDQKFKPSVHLGIDLIYSKREHFGWGAELTASHEGFKIKDPLTDLTLAVDPTYLRLTPKFYYFFGHYGDVVRPKLYAGPSIGFKLAEDQFLDGSKSDGKAFFDGADYFNTVDLGLTLGGGVNIRLCKGTWLNLDANYYHGLVDVSKDDGNNAGRHLRLNAGVMFGL